MLQLITIIVFVLAGASAQLPLPKTPGNSRTPARRYPVRGYEPRMPYSFSYAIVDAPTYNNFAHEETASARAVTGSYRVALPDGRTQIVTYKADENGYVADVRYEGKATYPEQTPSYRPNYKSAYKVASPRRYRP